MTPDATRTRALIVLIALLATATLLDGQEPKQMAITFDDLPFGYTRHLTIAEQREAVTRVLATLEKHRITATVFVIGRSVTDANRGLVDAFVRAGHDSCRVGRPSAFRRRVTGLDPPKSSSGLRAQRTASFTWRMTLPEEKIARPALAA